MKLRSGRSLSTAGSSVAPITRIGPRKSKPEVNNKSCIIEQRNKSFSDTSNSSSESVSSDSSNETWSASPKSAVRKRSSKTLPPKKFNIRGSSSPHKKVTRQMSRGRSATGSETVLALGNDLKNLSFSERGTMECPPDIMLVNKVVKQRSLLSKKRLLESAVPPEQTEGPPYRDLPSSQADHFKSPDAAHNEDKNNFPNEIKALDETITQGLESPPQSGNCRSFSLKDNTAKEGQHKSIKKNSSKCRQAAPKHRDKLSDISTTGTVKCATSVKTLVTKTLSGNTCKVIPVICIESSSSSEEKYSDRNSAGGNVEVKSNVTLENTMPTILGKVGNEELELGGNCDPETNKSVMKSVKVEEHDIPNHAPKVKLNCEVRNKTCNVSNGEESVSESANGSVVENKENYTGKTKNQSEAAGRPDSPGHVQTENVYSITKKEGTVSGLSVMAKLPARQTQTLSGRCQSGNRWFPTNKAAVSSQYFPRSNWGTSQRSHQHHGHRSAWGMKSGGRGSRWNAERRNAGLSGQRWHEGPGAYFDLQREHVPVITESNARNVSLLSHDYDRLGDALSRSYAAVSAENYHVQQTRLPAAHVSGGNQRFDAGTGMQNPVSVFGGNVYLPSSQPVRKQGLRPIIIDGSNVAMGHGGNCRFSYHGLQICVDYFVRRGHKVIAFLPQHRKCGLAAKDRLVLQQLEKGGHVVFTPSRRVDNRLVVPYDDWYIVQCAAVLEGVVVSNDNYRDLLSEDAQVSRAIKERLLMYTWVDNLLMFPKDPLGRGGPTLDQFLSFPAA